MATLMLENGVNIRYIQAMLGHVKLETTAIYAQVSIRKLKEIHAARHIQLEARSDAMRVECRFQPSIRFFQPSGCRLV